MKKTILITGATDGIGFKTADQLLANGHTVLLHGRSATKLQDVKQSLMQAHPNASMQLFLSDLSDLNDVVRFATNVKKQYASIDILINNAGVFKVPNPITANGFDVRFIVNTLAPYVLTHALLPIMGSSGRVINLSSAAQASVDLNALRGAMSLADSEAYAQSKLAITMWSFHLAQLLGANAPAIIAVNPASFLGSKMVKEAYGSQGKDLSIGADVLVRAALDDDFSRASGQYFDNDIGVFTDPHPDALDPQKNDALMLAMNSILNGMDIHI